MAGRRAPTPCVTHGERSAAAAPIGEPAPPASRARRSPCAGTSRRRRRSRRPRRAVPRQTRCRPPSTRPDSPTGERVPPRPASSPRSEPRCALLRRARRGRSLERRGRRGIGQRRTLTRRSDDMTTGAVGHQVGERFGRGSIDPRRPSAVPTGVASQRLPGSPACARPRPARFGSDRTAPAAWRPSSARPEDRIGYYARGDSPSSRIRSSWGDLPPRGLPSPCSPHGLPGRPRGPWSASHTLRREMFASGRAALFDSSARPRLDLGRVWRLARLHPLAATLR